MSVFFIYAIDDRIDTPIIPPINAVTMQRENTMSWDRTTGVPYPRNWMLSARSTKLTPARSPSNHPFDPARMAATSPPINVIVNVMAIVTAPKDCSVNELKRRIVARMRLLAMTSVSIVRKEPPIAFKYGVSTGSPPIIRFIFFSTAYVSYKHIE